jgi:hypothetical protein
MRRLTDDEMAALIAQARKGRLGPVRALDILWDLILREAEGISLAEAAERPRRFSVQDYAIAADQAEVLHAAMTKGRRLNRRDLNGVRMLWLDQSPAEYDPEPT